MKNNAIIRIVVFSVTILVLLGILVAGLCWYVFSATSVFGFHVTSETWTSEDVVPAGSEIRVPAEQVNSIDIEWVAGSITVQPGDVEEIIIAETGVSNEKYAMVWKQSGSRLKIQFCRESFSFPGRGFHDALVKDLVITVPKDWNCDSLEIDAASASLYVSDMTIWEVELDTASGVCEFENCSVNTIDLDTASGDIRYTGTLQELECDAASASFTGVLSNVPRHLDMDTMSGDLDITLPEGCGFTVSMDAMSSDFYSDFDTNIRGKQYVHGDGGCRIDINAMSGDVTIRKGK